METKNIRISKKVWERLIIIRERLTLERGRSASLDDVIEYLLKRSGEI